MRLNSRRVVWVVSALILTFVVLRVYLHFSPGSNLYFGPYNIHHLFIGLLLITFAGFPLILFNGNSRKLDVAAIAFGAGLSMALDEWVYLITTDGSDASYLLPISLWGGVVMVGLASSYALGLAFYIHRCERADLVLNSDAKKRRVS
ncbi:MAG: hypothetical protein ABIR84_03325 [Candidatus Nitrotoga sp.]